MALPPSTIRLKRRLNEEPVEFLRVHDANSKRKKVTQDYVFVKETTASSQSTLQAANLAGAQAARKIKTPRAATRDSSHTSLSNLQASGLSTAGSSQENGSAAGFTNSGNTTPIPSSVQPRKFVISRSATPSIPTDGGSSRKRKTGPTVFVERRKIVKKADGEPGVKDIQPSTPITETDVPKPVAAPIDGEATLSIPNDLPRPLKKPGRGARHITPAVKPTPDNVAPLRNTQMASGKYIPWDISSERLAAEMEAYTLQEIGKNLAKMAAEEPKPKPVEQTRKGPSRFKPKAPALRWAERNPAGANEGNEMEVEEPYVDDDDDDTQYIIETYIRMPAEALEEERGDKSVGLLIIESQPDIDEFYREEEDSDEEEDDGDEDENAENHYTADYPDEEVDSDDEFGRNPYHFRNHNASDLEEFGDDDEDYTFSDDENEATKFPWSKKSTAKRTTGGGFIVDDDDDDDQMVID